MQFVYLNNRTEIQDLKILGERTIYCRLITHDGTCYRQLGEKRVCMKRFNESNF